MRQVVPLQQPVEHDVTSQTQPTPDSQRCPDTQAAPPLQLQFPPAQPSASVESQGRHVAPSLPHSPRPRLGPVIQLVPSQQPVAHDVEVQMHPLAEQVCPDAQLGPPLHWHWPSEGPVTAH